MPKHDFSALKFHYPEIIEKMPTIFTAHQFILVLAQKYQRDYVCALYDYIDSTHIDTPAPFQMVHRQLASLLRDFPQLVEHVREDAPSLDIFGNNQVCSEWRKIA